MVKEDLLLIHKRLITVFGHIVTAVAGGTDAQIKTKLRAIETGLVEAQELVARAIRKLD